MQHLISGVTALYPRLDQPYTWSQEDNRSVPCEWDAAGAARTMTLEVPYGTALSLRKAMVEAYKGKKEAKWPKFKDNFILKEGSLESKDAIFHIRTQLKCYDKNTMVRHFDANNNVLPKDFQLTTGSTVNVQVTLVPWATPTGNGTSLRLNAVQVIELAPMQQASSPFEKSEGYVSQDASPFGGDTTAPTKDTPEEESDDWGEVEEPTKASSKSTPEVDDSDVDEDLDAIINEWGDD